MRFSKLFTGASMAAGISLIAGPLAFAPVAAFATSNCPTTSPAATEVSPGVCEVKFTETGNHTFAVPTGVTKVSGLIVGGGGGAYSNDSYAGGGGDVVYVDEVDLSADISVYVGAGGAGGSSLSAGEDSSINSDSANGGLPADGGNGGASGNGHSAFYYWYCTLADSSHDDGGNGGGAGGDAPDNTTGGPGVFASAISGVDATLFPAVSGEIEYGHGGNACVQTVPVANSGQGGSGYGDGVDAAYKNGADGVVILRFEIAPAKKTLAATGSQNGWYSFAGLLLVVAGVAARRRARKN